MRGTIRMLQLVPRFRAWWLSLLACTFALVLPGCGAEASSAKDAAAPRAAAAEEAMYEMPGPEPAPVAPGAPGGEMSGGNALGAQPPPPSDPAGGAAQGAVPGDS